MQHTHSTSLLALSVLHRAQPTSVLGFRGYTRCVHEFPGTLRRISLSVNKLLLPGVVSRPATFQAPSRRTAACECVCVLGKATRAAAAVAAAAGEALGCLTSKSRGRTMRSTASPPRPTTSTSVQRRGRSRTL
ncbi:unnamed protein product, partial [Ectocarpus fasciculatus]